jgi:glutamine amidotransferase/cyclase
MLFVVARMHAWLQVFKATGAAAALAAGIFHRKEVGIDEVKLHMANNEVPTRIVV